MSNDLTDLVARNDTLAFITTAVREYMTCSNLIDVQDDSVLTELLQLGDKRNDDESSMSESSMIFEEFRNQGHRSVCQYQFKRYVNLICIVILISCLITTSLTLLSGMTSYGSVAIVRKMKPVFYAIHAFRTRIIVVTTSSSTTIKWVAAGNYYSVYKHMSMCNKVYT
jgi:hypothetical protein